MSNPGRTTERVSRAMRFLARLASPVVRLLTVSTDFVIRMLGVRPSKESPVTEEEIRVLIGQGATADVFEEEGYDRVERVFRTADLRVSALMIPRADAVWLDADDAPDAIREKIAGVDRPAIPVCAGGLRDVVGVGRTMQGTAARRG